MKKILMVGMGDLGGRVLDILTRVDGIGKIVVAGRNEEYLRRKANLSMFAALQLGWYPEVEYAKVDLFNIDQTAETILKIKPDLIFNAATLQSWRMLTFLPKKVFEELDQAQFGPWLPMSLTLMHKLMQSVKQTRLDSRVVNAAFPDAVNPILGKIGLAPTIGIGNAGNIIPALRKSVAFFLGKPVDKVEVLFVAQHYISHSIPRFGHPENVPCYLRAIVDGIDMTDKLDLHKVYGALTKQFSRVGGTEGQILTAASAAKVLIAMVNDTGELAHAPGPNGLPGGYPVKVNAKGGTVWLPSSLSLEEAIRINEEGQRADGIDKIDTDGTVHFTDKEMNIMKRMLGYECKTMKVEESEEWARELKTKFNEFSEKYNQS